MKYEEFLYLIENREEDSLAAILLSGKGGHGRELVLVLVVYLPLTIENKASLILLLLLRL